MTTYDGLVTTMRLYAVPHHLRDGLTRYVLNGTEPGGFLRAVLQNDLRGAVSRGDKDSRGGLVETVMWLIAEAPEKCWGSGELFHDWVSHNGLEGVQHGDL